MRVYLLLLGFFGMVSCDSQKNDLLSIPFDQPVTELIHTNKLQGTQDVNYGVYSYQTDQLDKFRIGNINLKTYAYPNSAAADYNNLQMYVDNRKSQRYLGFRYTTVKQDEITALLEQLKKQYPEFERRKDSPGDAYFWDLKSLNAWLFYYPSFSRDKNDKNFLHSNFLFVKKGTRVENSKDTSVFTIWQLMELQYPK